MSEKTNGRPYIATMEPNRRVQGIFSISNAQLGRTKQDKPYLRAIIGDCTGQAPARMWSIDELTYERLPAEGFVYIEGETQAYQGALQVIVHSIDPVEPSADELRELLPRSKREPAEMLEELKGLLAQVEHPAMRELVNVYLEDEPLMTAFCQAPAAKSMHHAFLGGLLEHTLQVVKLAHTVCPLYPEINLDVVMVGLFLHDLGKTRELTYDRAFSYSDRGELVGHIVEGAIMLHDRAQLVMRRTGQRLPRHAVTVLQHIILSHHGVPEYGAAKVPSTPEAILVSILDNLDAKVAVALSCADRARFDGGVLRGNFTENQWSLGTKVFRPDPLAE